MRLIVAATVLSLSVVGLANADDVRAAIRRPTNIPAEALAPALTQLAHERSFQIVFRSEVVGEVQTRGAEGNLTVTEALSQLLQGTNLSFRYLGSNTVTIMRIADQERSGSARPDSTPSPASSPEMAERSFSGSFRLAQADQGAPVQAAAVNPQGQQSAGQGSENQLQEVIVTAEKRQERLQDVPMPITAVSAATLLENNQLLLKDYYSSIPGLSVAQQIAGSFQTLSIRGITTGVEANPTVGIMIDGVPFGTSTSNGGGGSGQIVPDIDPSDLARVEVLRGPQGTLYGASSMGGLVNFVTLQPSTDRLSGRVQALVDNVQYGAQRGYGARGSVNVPLSGTLAVSASLFARQDPGFIDNVQTGQRGSNEAQADGGRIAALWRPSEGMSLNLSALYQDIKGYGQSDVDALPGLGELQQSHLRGTGGYDRKVQAYSATLAVKLGSADLTAISGYNVVQFKDSYDLSFLLSDLSQSNFGVTGAFSGEDDKTGKFTQELRLAMPIGERLDWLLGAFYTYEKSTFNQSVLAADDASGAVVGVGEALNFPPTFAELALFTDVTIKITDRFDVQVGGRETDIKQTFSEYSQGAFVPAFYGVPSPLVEPELDSKENAFTYLVTPKFKLSPDFMLYARLASGYRAGGANYSAGPDTPGQYDPDKTYDYEVGAKGEFLDHRLSIDASLYYIDWKRIQVNEFNQQTGAGYFANAGEAKSEGLEFSVESRPLTGLRIGAWVAYDNAVLTSGFPDNSMVYGASGYRLPYTSRFSGNLTVQQDVPLSNDITGFVGGQVSYVGDRLGEFNTDAQRQLLPAYTKTDLRAGAQYHLWNVSLFVNNVTDRRGLIYGGLGAFPEFGFVITQPRTIGLSAVREF